tara:strand:+ start:747 stop:1361 length:615 start_codon:yes stop_codon:yes gene_type:complete
MPYYSDLNLLFIHIPKTGGTVIEDLLKKKHDQTLWSGFRNKILISPFNKISLQHQFYTTINKYKSELNIKVNDKLKIFSVVRNPYDRIISDLFWLNLIKKDDSAEKVFRIIKNNYLYREDLDNHNKPQYLYITNENLELCPDIKIFKTETLNQTNDDINNFIGEKIQIPQNKTKDYSKYLNKKSIALINKFYSKDFELFNYKLK